jgi:hypothetical protein
MSDQNDQRVRIIIRSADDAWELLQQALSGQDLPENLTLIFDGWPTFELNVRGKDWHSTVPTRVMGPLLEVQRDLHRAYANIRYGAPNLRKLSDEERDLLELVVKVEEGSSDYQAPMWEQFTELAKKAVEKMNSRDVVIAVLGAAVVFGGVEINKAWVAVAQEEKQVNQTVELSKQETERLKVFADAVKERPALKEARADFEASQNRLLKTVKPGDTVQLKGVALAGTDAMAITHNERARASDIHLTGTFGVIAIDASKAAGFRIKVARINDGMTFSATVPLELDSDQKDLIQKAEWSKGAKLVQLDIRATTLRGSITDAVVVSASELQ